MSNVNTVRNLHMIAELNVVLDAKDTALLARIKSGYLDAQEIETLHEEVRYIIREANRLTYLQKRPEDVEFAHSGEDSARLLDRIGDALIAADLNLLRLKARSLAAIHARNEASRHLRQFS
jgi:hypothetical protein